MGDDDNSAVEADIDDDSIVEVEADAQSFRQAQHGVYVMSDISRLDPKDHRSLVCLVSTSTEQSAEEAVSTNELWPALHFKDWTEMYESILQNHYDNHIKAKVLTRTIHAAESRDTKICLLQMAYLIRSDCPVEERFLWFTKREAEEGVVMNFYSNVKRLLEMATPKFKASCEEVFKWQRDDLKNVLKLARGSDEPKMDCSILTPTLKDMTPERKENDRQYPVLVTNEKGKEAIGTNNQEEEEEEEVYHVNASFLSTPLHSSTTSQPMNQPKSVLSSPAAVDQGTTTMPINRPEKASSIALIDAMGSYANPNDAHSTACIFNKGDRIKHPNMIGLADESDDTPAPRRNRQTVYHTLTKKTSTERTFINGPAHNTRAKRTQSERTSCNGPVFNTRTKNKPTEAQRNANQVKGPVYNVDFGEVTTPRPKNDPLTQRLKAFDEGSKSFLLFIIDDIAQEKLCAVCGNLVIRPLQIGCCNSICCFDCIPGNKCPLLHCGKMLKHKDFKYRREIDEQISSLSMHCYHGCGWTGCLAAHEDHCAYHCYQASESERVEASQVQRFIRSEVNTEIISFAKRARQLQISEEFDIQRSIATTLFRDQCKRIEHIALEMSHEQVYERGLAQHRAAKNVIQQKVRHLECLSTSNSTALGGVYQTFKYTSWEHIHTWIGRYVRALFPDETDVLCVDIGAGILVAIISGAVVNANTHWMGIEIDPTRLCLGAQIYSLFLEKWEKTSPRTLKVGFLEGDATQPLNLRGVHVCLLWDRAFPSDVVAAAFRSLARSYTQPFLLIMSNYYWKGRTLPLLRKVFQNIQVVGCSDHVTFTGGNSGDTLIMAIVGVPIHSLLASLPPLDEACASIFDVMKKRFSCHDKQRNEIERMIKRCNDVSTDRKRTKPSLYSQK